MPLKNQIIEWLKIQNYWLQYAGNELLECTEINDAMVTMTYSYFKEDMGLTKFLNERVPVTFNEVASAAAGAVNNIKLLSINNIENVNALIAGQEIQINKNLTLIYGENGSGKSGYIRLLNNTFNCRGDKNILNNVFIEATGGLPKCKFIFQSDTGPYSKEFPLDKNCLEFSQFLVFDAHCVKVHLDGDNQLNFIPSGFEFFDKVLQLFEAVKKKLGAEIQANKPINSFLIHFQNENVIRSQIQF